MSTLRGNEQGLTLVELLITVIVLGIIAAVAIPRMSSDTDHVRLAALDSSLGELRHAIELYYHQHGNSYPGARSPVDGSHVTTEAEASSAFVSQLTLYTDSRGITSTTKSATHKYGPYLRNGVPENPFNSLASVRTDVQATSIGSTVTDGLSGWKFYIHTGKLVANDGGHPSH